MIRASVIAEVAEKLYEKATTSVPDDVLAKLREALARESDERARRILEIYLKNIEAAEQTGMVVCQDTGLPVFFVRCGFGIEIDGDIRRAIAQGFEKLTLRVPYRAMAAHPLNRDRPLGGTGKGVPVVHFEIEPGLDFMEITAAPKGGGCGTWSMAELMLYQPDTYIRDIKKFVFDSVVRTRGQACPPYVVGVGLGGTLDESALLAARASLRRLYQRNPEPKIAGLEEELLRAINSTGIGPMGLGGDTTALAVNIEYAYTDVVWNPVAVNIQCWTCRRATARIYADGSAVFNSDSVSA